MADHKIQHISITFDDGGVGIMSFVLDPRLPEATALPGLKADGTREATDEAIQHEIDKSAFDGRAVVSWRRIKPEHVPTDRSYRNAWKDDGKAIGHDMGKARELHRELLRVARAPLLAELDVEYQKADEKNDKAAKASIAARKQKLRDITDDPRIAAAKTIDNLKQIRVG